MYCAQDFAAFQAVEGEGFVSLAQELVDIGASKGRVDVRQLLPCRQAVCNKVEELADEAKSKFMPLLDEAVAKNGLAATTDMWTQENKKVHFLTVICHMFNSKGKPETRTAFTVPFEESASGENIWLEVLSQFALLGINEEEVKKITFVTDRGANVVSALREVVRLNCTAHVINTVLKTALCLKKYELIILNEEASEIVQNVKDVMEHMNANLPPKMKEFPITKSVRANTTPPSNVPMLSAFVDNLKQVMH
jgi:hypothetical protein